MCVKEVVMGLAEENGYSVKVLANLLGESERNLNKKFSNGIDLELICKICDLFKISIDDLYSRYKKQTCDL